MYCESRLRANTVQRQQQKKEVPRALLIAGLQELINEGEEADRRRQARWAQAVKNIMRSLAD